MRSFRVPGYHRLWPDFPDCSTINSPMASPRSLVATEGVSIDFLSSGYLDISVPRVRLHTLCIQVWIPPKRWVSPFGNPRIKAILSAPRGLSQTYTSFIAFCRQGIHRVRLVTWSYNPKPSLFAIFPNSALDRSLAIGHILAYAPSFRSHSALISKKYLRDGTPNCHNACCISMYGLIRRRAFS